MLTSSGSIVGYAALALRLRLASVKRRFRGILVTMSLPRFLVLLGISTVLSWITWGLVLNYLDPTAGAFNVFLFAASLFLALSGTVAVTGFLVRLWRSGSTEFVLYRALATSVRQGFLLGALTATVLVLQGSRLLRWWNALALLLALAIVETLAQQQGRPRRAA